MSTIEFRFIEPLDILVLRGNKLFGDPGSFGECMMPPWPSVAAGAIRSRMLVDDGIDLNTFATNALSHPTLGTPDKPGSFAVAAFHLARRSGNSAELLVAPPADLVISLGEQARLTVSALTPQPLTAGLLSSASLTLVPILAQGNRRTKPAAGYWLTQAGWEAYLKGQVPTADQLVPSSELWVLDARVGIGMNESTRSVEEGKLFSTQAVVLKPNVGFIAAIYGATPPIDGLLRLGGDGRAASIRTADIRVAEPNYQAIADAKRCRLVLTSPGLFPNGWRLPGGNGDHQVILPGGIRAKLASASVPRAETVSGWDLAARDGRGAPKPAQRVAPSGSVYWLDELEATPESLYKLVENGLWGDPCDDSFWSATANRRAEGFNRIALTPWK